MSRFRGFCAFLCLGTACVGTAWGQYTISTVAGNNTSGFSGDSGAATSAQLNSPASICVGSGGKIYIADGGNNRIRMVSGGTITTVAGNGTAGYTGDNAAATSAELNSPAGVAVDSSGNLYIADVNNAVVRMVSPSGTITTFAGNNSYGAGFSGDGTAATNAQLNAPVGVAVDSAGNVYIADSNNNAIRKVSGGNIVTIVGTGSTAGRLNHPTAVTVDSAGNLYIADTTNKRIVKFSNGTLTTIAGNGTGAFAGDGGLATKAELNSPASLALDAAGNVYIADTFNNRIRLVNTSGIISTIAGNGRPGYSGDGGDATQAQLQFPHGVAVDRSSGNIYIADSSNNVIRMLQASSPPTITANGVINSASFTPQISPGSFASIVGTNLSVASPPSATVPLTTNLGGTSVTINGTAAGILYASPTLVNFQVPWEATTGNASVIVSVNGVNSNTAMVPVLSSAPGIFQLSGAAIAQNFDYSTNGPSNPAHAGSYLIVYLTGIGAVTPTVTDGANTPANQISYANAQASATIGGQTAQVLFTGLTPGALALAQMNIVVPSGLAAGTYPLIVTVGGQASGSANVSLAP